MFSDKFERTILDYYFYENEIKFYGNLKYTRHTEILTELGTVERVFQEIKYIIEELIIFKIENNYK